MSARTILPRRPFSLSPRTSASASPICRAQTLSPSAQLPRAAFTSRTILYPRTIRHIHNTPRLASILPDAEHPPPKTTEPHADSDHSAATKPTPLGDEAYHDLADDYLARVAEKVDELSETREDVGAEFDQGVLTISLPPNGTYVLNKQPPNHQIWLSSPVSGPKRFDWVVAGEGMHGKEGSGIGEWVYLRDGSRLSELLRRELGVSVTVDE